MALEGGAPGNEASPAAVADEQGASEGKKLAAQNHATKLDVNAVAVKKPRVKKYKRLDMCSDI